MGVLFFDSGGSSLNSGSSDGNTADLTGTANATVVSNKTFDGATDVDPATDQITVTAHGYTAGTGIELTGGTLPTGLTLTTLYYVGVIDANTITLHTNVADAEAGTNDVDITADGSGTITINNYTLNLGGTPDLSGVKGHHARVTTTGTSHVFTMAGGMHGFATGDPVMLEMASGATLPGGVTNGQIYYANALSTTTFRIYTTQALANAGGASDVNVTSAEVRTLVARSMLTSVATQSSIRLASASNSNRRIFWVRAVSDANDLLIVDAVVTGLGAGSDWKIGGRLEATGLTDGFNCIRDGGDTGYINTDLSVNTASTVMSQRVNSPAVFGWLSVIGKLGARRVIANAGNGHIFDPDPAGGGSTRLHVKNIEFQAQGTGAVVSTFNGFSGVYEDIRITDCGLANTMARLGGCWFIRSEISLFPVISSASGVTSIVAIDSYFHDITGDVFAAAAGTLTEAVLINCIVERCSDQGFDLTHPTRAILIGNTIYRCDNSGLELAFGVQSTTINPLILLRNIFKDNGNAAGEANVEISSIHGRPIVSKDNCFSVAGARGGDNLLVFEADALDITSDPLFVAPDASAGSRNFGLQAGSPAKGADYTFLNSLSVSYTDMGAVQSECVGGAPEMLFNHQSLVHHNRVVRY